MRQFIKKAKLVFKIMRAEPLVILYMFLLDFFMLLVFFLFASIMNARITSQEALLRMFNSSNSVFLVITSVVYILTLFLIYTFFKYFILSMLRRRLLGGRIFAFREIAVLLAVNFTNSMILLAVLLLAGFFGISMREEFKLVLGIILIPVLLVFYFFHTLTHTEFLVQNKKIREIYKEALKKLFSRNILLLECVELFAVILYSALFYLTGLSFLSSLQSANSYDKYVFIFTAGLLAILYSFALFNRIFLYLICIEKSNQLSGKLRWNN